MSRNRLRSSAVWVSTVSALLGIVCLALVHLGFDRKTSHSDRPAESRADPRAESRGPFQADLVALDALSIGPELRVSARVNSREDLPWCSLEVLVPSNVRLTSTPPQWTESFRKAEPKEYRFTVRLTEALKPTSLCLAVTSPEGRQEFYLDLTPPDATDRYPAPPTSETADGRKVVDPYGR